MVFHTILSWRMRLQTCLDSACITFMSLSVKFIFYQNYYQFRTPSLTSIRGGAPYPLGCSLPLLGSAPLLVLSLVDALFVALLRPVSSLLLSFADDFRPRSGSVFQLCSPEFQIHKTLYFPYRAPSVQNARRTSRVIETRLGTSVRLHKGQQRSQELHGVVVL